MAGFKRQGPTPKPNFEIEHSYLSREVIWRQEFRLVGLVFKVIRKNEVAMTWHHFPIKTWRSSLKEPLLDLRHHSLSMGMILSWRVQVHQGGLYWAIMFLSLSQALLCLTHQNMYIYTHTNNSGFNGYGLVLWALQAIFVVWNHVLFEWVIQFLRNVGGFWFMATTMNG